MSATNNFSRDEDEFVNIGGEGRVSVDAPIGKQVEGISTNNRIFMDYGVEAFSDLDTPTSEDEPEMEILLKSLDGSATKQQNVGDEVEANAYILKNGIQQERAELDAISEYAYSLQVIYMQEHSEVVEHSQVAHVDLSEEISGKHENKGVTASDHAKDLMDAYIKENHDIASLQEIYFKEYSDASSTSPQTQALVDTTLYLQPDVNPVEAQAHKDVLLGQQNEASYSKQSVNLALHSKKAGQADVAQRFFDEMEEYRVQAPQNIQLAIPDKQVESHDREISKPRIPFDPPLDDTFLQFVSSHIDSMSETLQPMPFVSHYNLGSNFRTTVAHKALTEFMGFQKGWRVTPSVYLIDNAFIAEYDSGRKGPVIGFDVEYGEDVANINLHYHNLTALSTVAAALVVAAAITELKLPGKIVLFGVPKAEKSKLINARAYSIYKVDINLISRPRFHVEAVEKLTRSLKVEYTGKQASKGDSEGVNALDALITAYNAIRMLKPHVQSGESIRSHITNGGSRPCTNHIYASGTFVIEALNKDRLEDLKAKVNGCFEAGASAAGATLKVTSSTNQTPDRSIERVCRKAFAELASNGDDCEVEYSKDEDSGVPYLTLGYVVPNGAGDAWWNKVQGAATIAGKAMGVTALEVLRDREPWENLLTE